MMRHATLLMLFIVFAIVLPTEAVIIPEAQINSAIEKTVRTETADAEDVEITCNHRGDVAVPGIGPAEIDVKLMSSGTPRGLVPVRVEIKHGYVALKTWMATADVRYFATIAVAARRINRHETMSEMIVTRERRDVTELTQDHYITDFGELNGLRTKRTILQGKLVDRASIESIPVVNRGDDITVIAEVGAITVSLLAKASEDGGIGDEIQVVNKDAKTRLRAKIIDAKRAKLIF